jgi:hypothetical protein
VVAEAEEGEAEVGVVLVVDEVEVSAVEVLLGVVEEEAHVAAVVLGVVEHRLANSCGNLCCCLFDDHDACWFHYVELVLQFPLQYWFCKTTILA